jgi:hypothetical protein
MELPSQQLFILARYHTPLPEEMMETPSSIASVTENRILILKAKTGHVLG